MARMRLCLVGAVALVAVSCQDHASPTGVLPPLSAEFFDATHGGGNPHFYLLPPFVSTPDLTKETFESGLVPSVRITEMAAAGVGFVGCTNEPIVYLPVAEFTGLKAYAAFWRPASFSKVAAPCIYRLQVEVLGTASSPGVVLGFADVQVLSKTTLKYLKTGQYIPLPKDLTLPFWFFIGQGAVFYAQTGGRDACRPGRDCVEAVISPTKNNVVITKNQNAGIFIPTGAFASPVTLVIEEQTERPCLNPSNLGLPQFNANRTGCYRYQRFPSTVALQQDLIVGMCVEIGGLTHEQADLLQIFRFDSEEEESEAQALANASAAFLPCEGTRFLGVAPRGVPAVLEGLRSFFAPRPLHAATVALIHVGVGGVCSRTKCLSAPVFTWGIAGALTPNGSTELTTPADGLIEPGPSVTLSNSAVSEVPVPVPGATVTFSVASGNGFFNGNPETRTLAVVTGAAGVAQVPSWTLPAATGTFHLTANVAGADPSTVTFAATGIAAPILAYRHSEQYSATGGAFDQYRLTVTNRASYPASMFSAAPDLPPCGLNFSSSQSWVDIYDGSTHARIYGFCALSSPNELNDIWFAVPRWTQPPSSVYVTITDRRAGVVYTSNTASLFGPLFVNNPRSVELNWSAVTGAVSYEIEMQYCESWASPDWRTCNQAWTDGTHLPSYTDGTSYIDTFVGDQPGRWRVLAKGATGNPIGSFTEYKYFTYITGPGAP